MLVYPYTLKGLSRMLDLRVPESNLIAYVGEGASPGAAGAGNPTPPTPDQSGPIPTPDAGGATTPTPPAGGEVPTPPADPVAAEAQRRADAAATNVRNQLRNQYGGDPDEIKAKLAELEKLKRAQMTAEEALKADKEKSEKERDEARAEALSLRIENTLSKYVAAHQPAYVGREDWILPQVQRNLGSKQPTPDNISKAVQEAVDAFVQAVPIATGAATGAAAGANRTDHGSQPGPNRVGAPGSTQPNKAATDEAMSYLRSAGLGIPGIRSA